MSYRVRVPHILGVVLVLSLAACGSAADKDSDAKGSPRAERKAVDAGTQECPDKHAATVEDDKYGGTADIDLCALPDVHPTAVSAPWVMVHDRPTGAPLNMMPVSCTSKAEDSCKTIKVSGAALCNQAKPDCHPQRGEKVPVVCSAVDKLNSDSRWYGVLLTSKRLLAMGTDHDRSYTKDFTDKGDISVGYVSTEMVDEVPGDLPACDGTMLHGSGARFLAQMKGLPLD
ncbi:hypothetical protein OG230_32380 [Streptomyces sp. NBC_00234]|uniref:hypothetical protein n=1 Tax=Streptomyces sp. NBC_00234 TaxID=2903638 RepID=UPI002E2DD9CE|nr:hypothetical protein [Streptomyces sp. NBC_00234]